MSDYGHSVGFRNEIWAEISRGAAKGGILVPHRNQRGRFAGLYIASRSRFQRDYIGVGSIEELKEYIKKGYSIRMSPRDCGGAPSLVAPESIKGWR